jgi:hypothetical protein
MEERLSILFISETSVSHRFRLAMDAWMLNPSPKKPVIDESTERNKRKENDSVSLVCEATVVLLTSK